MEYSKVEVAAVYKNLRYVVIGQKMGHRCGYVEVKNPTHQMINDPYSLNLDVHGGITWGEYSLDYPIEADKKVFWLGFDCAHSCDGKDFELMKELSADEEFQSMYKTLSVLGNRAQVRTTEYVIEECKKLIDQLV